MSRKIDPSTALQQSASTRVLQAAYSHYGNVMAVSSGDIKSATGMKRVFTAALLSTASFVAVGSAQAACIGTNDVVCVGSLTSQQEFSDSEDITVTVNAGASIDTRNEVAGDDGDNTGVNVDADPAFATIINNGDVKTGSEDGDYGHHHGLHANGYYGASVSNNGDVMTYDNNSYGLYAQAGPDSLATAINYGSVTTYGSHSDAVVASAESGSANAGNQDNILTFGNYSAGVVATGNSATAYNSEDGTIIVNGDGGDGVYAHALGEGTHAYAKNYGQIIIYGAQTGFSAPGWLNESGPDITEANDGQVIGIGAVGHYANAGNYQEGTISITTDGSVGIATSADSYAFSSNQSTLTIGTSESEDGFNIGVLAFAGDNGSARAGNSGTVNVYGPNSVGAFAYVTSDGVATAANYAGGSITMGASETSEDGSYSPGLLAVNTGTFGSAVVINGDEASSEDGTANIVTWADHSSGMIALVDEGGIGYSNESGIHHDGGAFATNDVTGSVITHGDQSFGVVASSTDDKYAVATNRGSITTYGSYSAGLVASGGSFLSDTRQEIVEEVTPFIHQGIGFGSDNLNYSEIRADNSGSITTYGHYAAGILVESKYANAVATNSGDITANEDGSDGINIRAKYGTATVTNSGDIVVHGSEGSQGIDANTKYADLTVTNTADGTITTYGEYAYGIDASTNASAFNEANANGGYVHVVNDGTINTYGNYADGIRAASPISVMVENTGTINVSGDYATGIVASAGRPRTTKVYNSGTITATGSDAIGVHASGPNTHVTNEDGGLISVEGSESRPAGLGTYYNAVVISASTGDSEYGGLAYFTNDGQIIGNVTVYGEVLASVLNTGSVAGNVYSYSDSEDGVSTIINDGGTITGGIFTRRDADISFEGAGNSIGRGVHALNSEDGMTTLAFNQTDTLTFSDGIDGYAISGVNEIAFNSGTTIFDSTDSEDGVNITGEAGRRPVSDSYYSVTTAITVGGAGSFATLGFVGDVYVDAVTTDVLNKGGLGAANGSSVVFSGDMNFASGGRLNVQMGAGNTAGLVTANTIEFAEGAYVNVDVLSGVDLTDGATTVVARGNSEDGSVVVVDGVGVGGMRVTDNTILFNFLTAQNTTQTDLELVAKRSLSIEQLEVDTEKGTNAESVGAALDEFIANLPNDNPIVIYLSQFPTPAAQEAALQQLVRDTMPEENAATAQGTIATTDLVFDLIMDRLSGGGPTVASNDRGGQRTGMSAGDIELGGEGQWAIWGRAGASKSEYTPSAINGFDAKTWGVTLGIDGGLSENLRGGLAYFHQNANVDENGAGANSGVDIKGNGLIAYMTWRPNPWYLNGSVGYSLNDYDNHRASLGGLNKASFDGNQFVARLEVGHDFKNSGWTITPNAGLRYSHVKTDGYTETGPLPLSVVGSSVNSVRGVAGVNVSYRDELESGSVLIPEASFEVVNEFANPGKAITATVIGGGTFVTQPSPRKDLSFGASAGVTYEASDTVSVRLMYKGEYGKDYIDNGVQFAVRFAF